MSSNTTISLKHDASETVCLCHEKLENIETLIIGFPGQGLVGSISAKYIIKELKLKVVGYIRSPLIPPLAVFLDGVLAYPYRIYANNDSKIAVLIGESPAPINAYYYLANAVLDWSDSIGTKEIICMDGFVDNRVESKVYMVAEPDVKDFPIDLPRPQTGYIGGLSGAILNETMLRDVNGYALLVSTAGQFPDPVGAAKILESLNSIKNLNLDFKSLMNEGEKIKKTMKEFAERTQQLADSSTLEDTSSFYT